MDYPKKQLIWSTGLADMMWDPCNTDTCRKTDYSG